MENLDNQKNGVSESTDIAVDINIKSLLQAGVHFGTKKATWCPKAASYIYGVRNEVFIINLDDTISQWDKAREMIVNHISVGGSVLFVGTKRQARDAVITHASRCGQPYVAHKWSAGSLTNFSVLRKSVDRLDILERKLKKAVEGLSIYTKKEVRLIQRQFDTLNKRFGGLRGLKDLPTLVFITDAKIEGIAVREAAITGIETIGLADTDCDPTTLTVPIPANDDALKSLNLFCAAVADAVIEGKQMRELRLAAEKEETEAKVALGEATKVAPVPSKKQKNWKKR